MARCAFVARYIRGWNSGHVKNGGGLRCPKTALENKCCCSDHLAFENSKPNLLFEIYTPCLEAQANTDEP